MRSNQMKFTLQKQEVLKVLTALTQNGRNTYVGKNGDYVAQNDIGYSSGSTKKIGSPTMTWSWR
jgi:hypothetical protein